MIWKFFIVLLFLITIDQLIKFEFVEGFVAQGDCISFVLAYNYGVAFSMFEFLAENLKFLQIALLGGVAIYLYLNKDVFTEYYLPIAFIFAGGISNIADRFMHGAVVDYVYWHCGFDFAIFNLADVLIDIGVVWILWIGYKASKNKAFI